MKGRISFIPFGDINTYSSRITCYQNAEELRRLGWACDIGMQNAEAADFVVFQKRYSPSHLALAKRCKGKVILSMCDPDWLIVGEKNIGAFIEIVDCVVTTTKRLASWFEERGKRVEVIPEGFDFKAMPKVQKHNKLTLCWHGTSPNEKYLEVLIRPLNKLSKEFTFDLKLIADNPHEIPKLDFEPQIVKWELGTHLAEIAKCHIGLAPLANTEWCSYKSLNKAITYMALELPVVCTSIPSYEEIIVNGKNGFLIKDNNPYYWYQALKILITNKDTRSSFVEEGKRIVQFFTLEKMAKKWDELFRKS